MTPKGYNMSCLRSILFPWVKTEKYILYVWLVIAGKPIAPVVYAPSKTSEGLVVVLISNFGAECLDQVPGTS